MERYRHISAGILAGGESKRMGYPKANLTLDGKTFLDRIADQLPDFGEILVSVNDPEQYEKVPGKPVVDELPGFGPLEGIYQLLKAAKEPYLLAVAADMPFLERAFLNTFAEKAEKEADCTVLVTDERTEPLCGIYSKTCIPVIEEMRAQGVHAVQRLFERVRVCYIPAEELGFGRRQLVNVNTPEDYGRILHPIKAEHGARRQIYDTDKKRNTTIPE